MTAVGQTVYFPDYDDEGEPILVHGTVEAEFREPPEEDPFERLNYRVRTADNRVFTPYAADCTRIGTVQEAAQ